MARYYLHLHECGTLIPDEDGMELANDGAAHAEAIKAARDVMAGEVKEGRLCLGCCIVITDYAGTEVGRVPFREALIVTGT